MTVLVTGAQGFIGRFLCEALLESGASVIGIGRSPRDASKEMHCAQRVSYSYRQLDVNDTAALWELLRESRPQKIVHLATPLRDEPWPRLSSDCIAGSLSLTQAAVQSGLECRIVLGSSAAVYGPQQTLPIAETAPCIPNDLYGVAKYAAERLAFLSSRGTRVSVVSGRLFNVLGPGEDQRHAPARFARQAVDRAQEKIVVGDLRPTRDFIDVRDAADALIRLSDEDVPEGVYNVCSGIETSIRSILDVILEIAGTAPEITQEYVRDGDIQRHVGNPQKLLSLGFSPRFDVRDSLGALVQFYKTAGAGS